MADLVNSWQMSRIMYKCEGARGLVPCR